MAVTVYLSNDPGAPLLDGNAGSLITVLDACLVSGYGAKAAAGWTKSFSSTNKADYKQGIGSLGHYLDVDDNGPGAGGGLEARIRGFEVMTAVGVGSGLYPSITQQATGVKVRKSVTADNIIRPWIIVADHRTVYMWVLTADYIGAYLGWAFGEYYSFKLNDLGRNFIQGRVSENSGNTAYMYDGFDTMTNISTKTHGMYVNRDVNNAPGAIESGKMGDYCLTSSGTIYMKGYLQFTNPADARVYLAPLRVNSFSSDYTVRGRLRGLWFFTHPVSSVSDRDTFLGVDDLSGKTFMIIKKSPQDALWCVEISSTWETN